MDELSGQSHHFLHALCINPDVQFESQAADERVILLLRAHPITQLSWVLNSIFLLILLFVVNFFVATVIKPNQQLFLNVFGLAFIFSYVWFNFLNWFFNVGIVTNERIVDVDFTDILYKEVTATRFNKVEEVTSKSGGYIGSIFNFGNVFIETASAEINIEFINVPDPSRVVQIINNLMPH